jgi:hypothetical protein
MADLWRALKRSAGAAYVQQARCITDAHTYLDLSLPRSNRARQSERQRVRTRMAIPCVVHSGSGYYFPVRPVRYAGYGLHN